MDKEFDLDTLSQKVADDFKAAEQARAYVTITAEHGPSQQLIDFINFDGKLGEEIGLEGWSDFSTTTQHEILLSKLNPDAMEAVAMEGFSDFVKKYRYWLTGAGVFAIWAAGAGIISLPIFAAGVAGIVMKNQDSLVLTKTSFTKWLDLVDDDMAAAKELATIIPSGSDEAAWNKYATSAEGYYKNIVAGGSRGTDKEAPLKTSGWTPADLLKYGKDLDATVKKFIDIRKSFDSKMAKFESMGDKAPKESFKALSKAASFYRALDGDLSQLNVELKKVAKGFEVKKKD